MLAYHRCSSEHGSVEAGGEARWKTSRICTKRQGGLKVGSEHFPALSFVLGRHTEKGFPLKENFLTEKTVCSLRRERVSVFVRFLFSL